MIRTPQIEPKRVPRGPRLRSRATPSTTFLIPGGSSSAASHCIAALCAEWRVLGRFEGVCREEGCEIEAGEGVGVVEDAADAC